MKTAKNNMTSFLVDKVLGNLTGNYGHDNILRVIAKIPDCLPINARIQHGWYARTIPDLKYSTPLMLVWSKRIQDAWHNYSSVPAYVLGSPFVRYRHFSKIKKDNDAKGTVVFPQHSTPNYYGDFDLTGYCESLSKLPKEFEPLTICIHFRDYELFAREFECFGFKVVTAGHSRQGGTGFVDNFYRILAQHQYSTSNNVGSYSFYSVEMGIPFFVYGNRPVIREKKSNKMVKDSDSVTQKAIDMFSDINLDVTEEQKAFVNSELGINSWIKKDQLRELLYKNFRNDIKNYPKRVFHKIFISLMST